MCLWYYKIISLPQYLKKCLFHIITLVDYIYAVIFSWQLEIVPAKHFGIRMPTWVRIRMSFCELISLLFVNTMFVLSEGKDKYRENL